MSEETAKILVDSGAVSFNIEEPFTYASGVKSPIYTDCRALISKPDERIIVSKKLQDLILLESEYPDIICGTASAGIPWAAWVSEVLDKPMIYIRKNAKDHGKGKQVEGILNDGDRAVVLDDLVSTGGSVLDAVRAVRENGGIVTDVCCIFSYGFESSVKNFSDLEVRMHSATTLEDVLEYCLSENVLSEDQAAIVRDWISDPEGWGR